MHPYADKTLPWSRWCTNTRARMQIVVMKDRSDDLRTVRNVDCHALQSARLARRASIVREMSKFICRRLARADVVCFVKAFFSCSFCRRSLSAICREWTIDAGKRNACWFVISIQRILTTKLLVLEALLCHVLRKHYVGVYTISMLVCLDMPVCHVHSLHGLVVT